MFGGMVVAAKTAGRRGMPRSSSSSSSCSFSTAQRCLLGRRNLRSPHLRAASVIPASSVAAYSSSSSSSPSSSPSKWRIAAATAAAAAATVGLGLAYRHWQQTEDQQEEGNEGAPTPSSVLNVVSAAAAPSQRKDAVVPHDGSSSSSSSLSSSPPSQPLHAPSSPKNAQKQAKKKETEKEWPIYTLDEVAQHKTPEKGFWVTYKEGVYDITEFLPTHPGGRDKIMMAVGGSVEPFWALYAVHDSEEVRRMLEEYRIGSLSPADLERKRKEAEERRRGAGEEGPYAHEPTEEERHPALVAASKRPFNAEPPLQLLADNWITPNALFFVRNHLPVPFIDPKDYVLEVDVSGIFVDEKGEKQEEGKEDGKEQKVVKLTLEDLKTKFERHSVTATLQCAGNRRSEMNPIKKVRGLTWGNAAISNAVWTGVLLRDVLKYCGIDENGSGQRHIQFEGLDTDGKTSYGGSIPIEKAIDPRGDVLLAFEMNGKELPRDHGYPLRVIVPGTVGARNVKWLGRIVASKEESKNFWQTNDYKGFSPNIDWDNVDFNAAPAIQELPVQSAICSPADDASIPADSEDITIKGYAWSGGGRGIIRVDVSLDDGRTWQPAELKPKPQEQPYNRTWAWTLWELTVPIPKDHQGDLTICCKAIDSSYNVQPDTVAPIWNLRGVLSNAWHRVKVHVPKVEGEEEKGEQE